MWKFKALCVLLTVAVLAAALCSCRAIRSDVGRETDESDTTESIITDAPETTEKAETTDDTKAQTDNEDTTDSVGETSDDGKAHVESISLDKYSVEIGIGSSDMPMVTMYPENAENVGEIWESDNTSVATVNKYGKITGVAEGECTVTVTSADNRSVSAKVSVVVKPAAGLTYIQGILIANKSYSLPEDYNPGVDATASAALNEMISSAASEGISLWIVSGFRSWSTQYTLYNNYVARDGKAAADRYSARPGYSEHQTGLAFDLNSVDQSFGETKEGKWLAANCWKYGFIIRYPADKESVTGYMYEPWHVRYIGEEMAKKVYDSGLCLEEYLNIKSVYAN